MSEAEIIRHSCILRLPVDNLGIKCSWNDCFKTFFYRRILSLSEYIYNILHPLVVAKYREDYEEYEYWY